MARQIDEFTFAWNSLSGNSEQNGWRSISVFSPTKCEIRAARHFPGNEESLLISFPDVHLPRSEKLPESRGFIVEIVDMGDVGKTWIALTRKESGNTELFGNMVCDVVSIMDKDVYSEPTRLLRIFLSRLHSWQEFMRKGNQALGPEEEIGLFGELSFLRSMIKMGASPLTIVESWVGPIDGVQDFEIGTGAIEVKTTISTTGFIAKIGSLEQLDDSIRQPLFLAALQLTQTETGINLPEFINSLLNEFNEDLEAARIFDDKLVAAGYHDAHADRYIRRFTMNLTRVFEVSDDFPRLIHGKVPSEIKKAVYELDVDRISSESLGVSEILIRLGVL